LNEVTNDLELRFYSYLFCFEVSENDICRQMIEITKFCQSL